MGRIEDVLRAVVRRGAVSIASVVLDAGAVIALARGDAMMRALLAQAVKDGTAIVVSPVVIAQTIRGGSADAPIHRLLKVAMVPTMDAALGIEAGRLLGANGLSDAADALIVADAIRRQPCVLFTSDPRDILRLAGVNRDIRIVTV